MKKLIQVQEVEGEGLEGLMGQNVMLFCLNYIYWGKLVGVNETFVKLENAHLVYETGSFSGPLKDAQKMPKDEWYVRMAVIESFGVK